MATTRTISTLAGLAATVVLLVAAPGTPSAHAEAQGQAEQAEQTFRASTLLLSGTNPEPAGRRPLPRLATPAAETTVEPVRRLASARGGGYGWPVRPFDVQHPVRGFFGDPRIGADGRGHESRSFHFGVDVSAPDGTAVYATASGRIVWEPERPQTVAVTRGDGSVFAYWHIVPAVRNGAYAVAYETVLGHIAQGWAHVHFAEFDRGRYVNPLRRGALTPYADATRPTIHTLSVEHDGTGIGRKPVAGRLDLVTEVWDDTPVPVPGKWAGKPVMPALVQWRVVGARPSGAWRVAIDFSGTLPAHGNFEAVYARWTRQNHPWRTGRYRVVLERRWDSRTLSNGDYRIQVAAFDTSGNGTVRSFPLRVRNAAR